MNISLKGKRALIGGSSRGLGFAVAKQLARSGASVTLMSRNENKLKEIVANLESETKNKHNYLVVDFNNFSSFKTTILSFLKNKPNSFAFLLTVDGWHPNVIATSCDDLPCLIFSANLFLSIFICY